MPTADSTRTLAFIRQLWPDGLPDDAFLVVGRPRDGKWKIRQTNDPSEAAYWLTDAEDPWDYLNCGALRHVKTGRGRAVDVIAIPGFWLDLDTRDGNHKCDPALLPTKEQALELLRSLPIPPTLILDSGGGYYAWWIFAEPWVFSSDADRQLAAQLSRQWQGFVQDQARARGFEIDGTASLDRVLRAEGTVSHKYDPVRLVVQVGGTGANCNPSDFDSWSGEYHGGAPAVLRDTHSTGAVLGPLGISPTGEVDRIAWTRAESALRYISPDSRDTWMRIGMALKSLFGDEAFPLWDRWSAECKRADQTGEPSYQPRTQRAQWDSFQIGDGSRGSVNPATLWKYAIDGGWPDVIPPHIAIRVGKRASGEPGNELGQVFIPGGHMLPDGSILRVSNATFCDSVFNSLPRDVFYRRGGIPGEIIGDEFRELTRHRARILTERYLCFVQGKPPTKADEEPTIVFRAITADHGEIIIGGSLSDSRVQELDLLTPYPVCLPDWSISPPGFSQGVYYTGSRAPDPITDRDEIRSTLLELLVDFPFAGDADRENFIGLLLTPIVRRACGGPAPLHVIASGMPRTGKSKLAETVFGIVTLGRDTPAFRLGSSEDEREKRIFAMLLAGETTLYIDNLNDKLDSASLASLLTSNVYRGRELGASRAPALPNNLTTIVTANNPRTSEEISKRVVPIVLESPPNPEVRTDFRHPQLTAYIREQRDRIRACLHGMVANWRAAGAPAGPARPMGGFEGWASVVGGILDLHGFSCWLANASGWREAADEFSVQVEALVAAWADSGRLSMTASELLDLASAGGLFPEQTDRDSRRGAATLLARDVLSKLPDRPAGGYRVRRAALKGVSTYHLEKLPS